MSPVAKWLILGGLSLVIIGLFWHFVGRWLPLGKLPGDILIEREHVRVYFPLTTMIILSILLSLLFSLGRFFR